MSINILTPPDARPTRPRALPKGWAQEMLARCAGKPDVVALTRKPVLARRSASGHLPDPSMGAATRVARRAVRLNLPTTSTD